MNKRLLSLLLACCFVFSLLPMSAMADEAQTTSGTCGENVTWTLVDGVLTISGTGAMDNYSWGDAPWYDMADAITSIEVGDGVVSIGDHAFRGLTNVESAALAYSVESIGEYAFAECSQLQSIDIPDSVESIGDCAFQNCSNLRTITLPTGITSIGMSAFNGCTSLNNISIPEGPSYVTARHRQ